MVVLAFLSCGNGSYTTPNPTRMQRSPSHASGSADAAAFPSLRMVFENVFEAGRHTHGKREEPCHGRLSQLNDECIQLRCSSIIFHMGMWLRHDDVSVFKPSLRTPLDLMSRDNWIRRGGHFPSGSPKSWKSQKYAGVDTTRSPSVWVCLTGSSLSTLRLMGLST